MRHDSWSDVSVQISRRRWRCVPDAQLCLSQWGAAFIHRLASHAEIWITPEFLHVLDDWELYDSKPELLARALGDSHSHDDIRDALRLWLSVREETGARGGRVYWIRDSLRESSLPPGVDDSIVPQWETMAEALDGRLARAKEASGPIAAFRRDAAALLTALPAAFMLTVRDRESARSGEGARNASRKAPSLCQNLESWGLPCRHVSAGDDLVALERTLLLNMLVEAGLCGYLWSGLTLSVVHVVAPGGLRGYPGSHGAEPDDGPAFLGEAEPRIVPGPWENAQAFWYDLRSETL